MDQIDQPSVSALTAPAPPIPWFRRRRVWAGTAVLLAVAVGSGFAGASVVDPTASDQYRDVSAQLATSQHELERVQDNFSAAQGEIGEAQSSAVAAAASAAQVSSDASRRQAEMDAREAELITREGAVAATEQQIAANTIGPGTYVVGVDMQPGTYRPESAVSSSCYWGIYKSGTNGDDIIDNDIPGGGFPTVTVSEGQDFSSTRCGNWVKQ